ncbi:MAG: isochorismatase family protein [Verrucomicrobiota bacterium]|jgi:nicotinamidase-related amidase|nr:isochorismatase family protein [Verrucomicrobiota bacterium]MDD8046217.1 isochorismatase family protein [Verrucomicrobiota bacterium]MDD8049979.1 isochorismatase family protein [Verrucomicrobiota bacterium]MDI9384549.1 isochorismatase family protein [Verrucomicrobiota bacterium]
MNPDILFAHLLDPTATGVIVIDAQERLVQAMPKDRCDLAMTRVTQLIEAARVLELPILVTEQYPKGLGPTIEPIRKALGEFYQPLSKTTFSCCEDGAIRAWIEEAGCRNWVLAGMETHVCVYLTAVDLLKSGKLPHVAADAVISRRQEHEVMALQSLRQLRVRTVPVETIAFQLLGEAGTDRFKRISALFK